MLAAMIAAPVQPGDVLLGKYRVDRVLGVGGMGVVVAATHLQLGQPVALKFMLVDALASAEAAERFLREARAAVRLRSQHVARIQDVGTLENGAPYIVMELLQGMDLAQVLAQQGPLPPTTAVDFVLQACDAIAEAHASGIVHRDLKPANLFVTVAPSGAALVKVLDFGIAKAHDPLSVSMTQTSAVFGSPAYMSPEQLRSSKAVDARADIWSLGIILYETLCGQVPFHGETITELGLKVVMDPLPPLPRIAGMKPGLEAVIYRCLEKAPEARPASVAELAAQLAPFASPSARALAEGIQGIPLGVTAGDAAARVSALTAPPRRSAKLAWVVGLVVVAAIAVGGVLAAAGGGDATRGDAAVAVAPRTDGAVAMVGSGRPDAAPARARPDAAVALAPAPDAAAALVEDPPPWSAPPLPAKSVPAVYLAQWRKAENRATCPPLVPTDLGAAAGAQPRAATFYGGWAVAYDKKGLPGRAPSGYDCATCGRSVFGVAGAGVEKGGANPFGKHVRWSDGSELDYGLEGGTGPGYLGFLARSDAGCLYNIWSAIGEDHLLQVIAGLRRVEGAP
jgi:serine/threonine-protein kinase